MALKLRLSQIADLIASTADGDSTLVLGEMGIGKSALLSMLAARPEFKDHFVCYADMTTKDVGDLMVPKIRTINGQDVCSFIPNEEFGLHLNRPVLLMLDEIGKTRAAVLNAVLRLLNEGVLAGIKLPPGSKVFATSNLSAEGLGDALPEHVRNRLIIVEAAKTPAAVWIEEYAIPKGLNPVILSTVHENPQMFASYSDYESPEQNIYINDPRTVRESFVTHRSMERAARILDTMLPLGNDVVMAALAGTIGEPAAHLVMTTLRAEQQLPSWDEICATPETATVPTSEAYSVLLVTRALNRIERNTLKSWLVYMQRLSKEAQALFTRSVMRPTYPKREIVAANALFAKLQAENSHLFARAATVR